LTVGPRPSGRKGRGGAGGGGREGERGRRGQRGRTRGGAGEARGGGLGVLIISIILGGRGDSGALVVESARRYPVCAPLGFRCTSRPRHPGIQINCRVYIILSLPLDKDTFGGLGAPGAGLLAPVDDLEIALAIDKAIIERESLALGFEVARKGHARAWRANGITPLTRLNLAPWIFQFQVALDRKVPRSPFYGGSRTRGALSSGVTPLAREVSLFLSEETVGTVAGVEIRLD